MILPWFDNYQQSSAVGAQYHSGQQNHPTLGQQPPGQRNPSSHCLGAAIFVSCIFLVTTGQSSRVGAHHRPSGQHSQPTLGQQPPGPSVPAGHSQQSHCFGAAICVSWIFLVTTGQSSRVGAQFRAGSGPGQHSQSKPP